MSISRLCDWGSVRKRIKFSTPSLVLRIVSIIVNHNKVESVPSTLNQWANICSDVTPRHWLYRHLLIVSFHLSYLLCCALIVSVHKTLIENVLQIAFNKRVIIIVPFCVFLSHFRGVPTWMVKGHTCKTSLLRFIVMTPSLDKVWWRKRAIVVSEYRIKFNRSAVRKREDKKLLGNTTITLMQQMLTIIQTID